MTGHEEYPVKIVFCLSLTLLIGAMLRQMRGLILRLFDQTILFFLGFTLRAVIDKEYGNFELLNDPFSIDNPGNVFIYITTLMPIYIFDASFNLNMTHLKNKWPHIIVVVIPSTCLTFVSYYYIGTTYWGPSEFRWQHYMMILSILLPKSYRVWRRFCTELNVSTDTLSVIHVEQVATIILAVFCFHFSFLEINQTSATRYKDILLLFLGYILSTFTGFVIAKLVFVWTSQIPKDHSNTTTIILTFVYITYLICGLAGIPAPFAVFVMGLTLASTRDTMLSTFLVKFNKLCEVIHFIMSSALSVQAGQLIYDCMFGFKGGPSYIHYDDYVHCIMLYALRLGIRLLTVFFSRIKLFQKGYIENVLNCIVLTVSTFSGHVGIMLAFTLMEIFKRDEKLYQQMFLISMMNIVLSVTVNQFLSILIIFLQARFSDMKDKNLQLERAARFLIETKNHYFVSLKNDTFIADADWDKVLKYTLIKDDIMREYRNKQWLRNPSKASVRKKASVQKTDNRRKSAVTWTGEYFHEINVNVKAEAAKQIGKSEREIYRHMYTQGTINKKAFVHLTYFAENIIRQSRLTQMGEVIKSIQQSKRLLWLHNCLLRSFVPKKHLRRRFAQYSMLAFVDLVFTVISVRTHVFANQTLWSNVSIIHNLVLLGLFTTLFFYEIITMERTIFITRYHLQTFLTFFIILTTAMDFSFVYFISSRKTDDLAFEAFGYYVILLLFIVSRFMRMTKMVEVSHVLKEKIMSYVVGSIEKDVYFTCDVCRAILKAQCYSHKKISAIVKNRFVALHLRYIGHSQRLEIKQFLALLSMKNMGVVTAYKTRLAIKQTLNSMLSKLDMIESSGMINEADSETIRTSIEARIFSTKKLATNLPPVTVENLILNIPWVNNDTELASFIMCRGRVLIYSPHDVIVTQGHMPQGLFIILFGLVRIEQNVNMGEDAKGKHCGLVSYLCKNQAVLTQRRHTGEISGDSGTILQGFLNRGDVIGEMSQLTGKPGHKTLVCATHVEVLVVSYQLMARKINVSPITQEMSVLEHRMWNTIAIRQAVAIMQRDTSSHGLLHLKLMNHMCNTFIIDGYCSKIIPINWSATVAAVLIRGFAMNFFTNAQYVGPCLIPDYCCRLVCQPERGMRVIILVVKKTIYEESSMEFPHYEDQVADRDMDNMTLSSGSSLCGPVLTLRPTYTKCDDEAVKVIADDCTPVATPKSLIIEDRCSSVSSICLVDAAEQTETSQLRMSTLDIPAEQKASDRKKRTTSFEIKDF